MDERLRFVARLCEGVVGIQFDAETHAQHLKAQ
jgi:hypothetical protein